MSTQLLLVADERGFTVQLSTNHQTQAGALTHFTEVLAHLRHSPAPLRPRPHAAINRRVAGA